MCDIYSNGELNVSTECHQLSCSTFNEVNMGPYESGREPDSCHFTAAVHPGLFGFWFSLACHHSSGTSTATASCSVVLAPSGHRTGAVLFLPQDAGRRRERSVIGVRSRWAVLCRGPSKSLSWKCVSGEPLIWFCAESSGTDDKHYK